MNQEEAVEILRNAEWMPSRLTAGNIQTHDERVTAEVLEASGILDRQLEKGRDYTVYSKLHDPKHEPRGEDGRPTKDFHSRDGYAFEVRGKENLERFMEHDIGIAAAQHAIEKADRAGPIR